MIVDSLVSANAGITGTTATFSSGIYTNSITLPVTLPTGPSIGTMYFNTTDNTLCVYNGSAWISFTGV